MQKYHVCTLRISAEDLVPEFTRRSTQGDDATFQIYDAEDESEENLFKLLTPMEMIHVQSDTTRLSVHCLLAYILYVLGPRWTTLRIYNSRQFDLLEPYLNQENLVRVVSAFAEVKKVMDVSALDRSASSLAERFHSMRQNAENGRWQRINCVRRIWTRFDKYELQSVCSLCSNLCNRLT